MTPFTVTIHPRTDFTVLLSHVQSFRSLGGCQEILKKRTRIREKGKLGVARGVAMNSYTVYDEKINKDIKICS